MTIEEATRLASEAASAADVKALGRALEARAEAIAKLAADPPSEELAVRLRSAIEAGEALQRQINSLKRKLNIEYARLSQIRTGFVTGLRPSPIRKVDCRG